MSSDRDAAPAVEVNAGDVTIGTDGKIEITNPRLAELIRAAVTLQKGQGTAADARGINYGCPLNYQRCGREQL